MNAGLSKTVLEMARKDPEAARAFILEQGIERFADGLLESLNQHQKCFACGCKGRHVWAFRLFANVAKLVGSPTQIMLAFFNKFGVRSEDELVSLVESGKKLEQSHQGKAPEEYAETALRVLEWSIRERPGLKAEVLKRLESAAEVVE